MFTFEISKENAIIPKQILGSKGLSLCTMKALSLNVPDGFICDTNVFRYYDEHKELPQDFLFEFKKSLQNLGEKSGTIFGSKDNPLLVSVRSGASASMPGMMDSLLNIGLVYEGLLTTKDFSIYYAFLKQYFYLVEGLFLEQDGDDALTDKDAIIAYFQRYEQETGKTFNTDPFYHLENAVVAVLKSVYNRRAKTYRMIHNISAHEIATAVIIQRMVFGQEQGFSGAGVAVSRNPNTGQGDVQGEFLFKTQGDSIVGGKKNSQSFLQIEQEQKALYEELLFCVRKLEKFYSHPVEVEFTIENDKLWFLQARKVKISDEALIHFVIEEYQKNHISASAVLSMVSPAIIERFLHATVEDDRHQILLDKGVPASLGAASGKIVFTAEEAVRLQAEGEKVILVRHETSPEDIYGMYAAVGVLTARGGMTSHAAVVARGMGRPCVTAVHNMKIDVVNGIIHAGKYTLKTGDIITVNGTTGDILLGAVKIKPPSPPESFYIFNQIAEKHSRMSLRANIDSIEEAEIALQFHSEGIGLYRTEYAICHDEDVYHIRRMVLAETKSEREEIGRAIQYQKNSHFKELFNKMKGFPVTIRLLDPPLHEFFPALKSELFLVAQKLGVTYEFLKKRLGELKEFNPMIGVRGCRLGILYPEIYEAQTKVILNAILEVAQETGDYPDIEIMIPFIGFESEFLIIRDSIIKIHQEFLLQDKNLPLPKIGAMIELPRAALCADKIAIHADFLSFGTNDLTQTVLGISRDDSPRFMQEYVRKKLVPFDPFVKMDIEGVGMLIAIATDKARSTNPNITIGLCGEHGADPDCVQFCEMLKIDYISCSAYRLPSARLAAAQSYLKAQGI